MTSGFLAVSICYHLDIVNQATAPSRTLGSMKLRPLLVIAAVAAFFAALARKRVEEAKPTESWEPVSYS